MNEELHFQCIMHARVIHDFLAILQDVLKDFWMKKCNKNYQVSGYVLQIIFCSSDLFSMLHLQCVHEIQFLMLTAVSLAARFNQINTGQLVEQ